MRNPIFVRVERFDLKNVESEITSIRDCFDRYLDSYPVKSARSKYSLMGPVGKVLQEVRVGKWDAESLVGYALNIHLSNPKTRGYIGQESRMSLKEGINKLFALLQEVPITAHDKIVDRIDYGLYFIRRVKGLEWLEWVRQEFMKFLKEKYKSTEALTHSWGGKPEDYGDDFNKIPYPSKELLARADGKKKDDIAEFIKQVALKGYEPVINEEVDVK